MQNTDDLLSLCRKYLPGVVWQLCPGWAIGIAGPFFVELQLESEQVTAICKISWEPVGGQRCQNKTIMTSDRFPDAPLTNEQALAQIAARWHQFSSEAMAVVEPQE
jgi:hypothetical protein